MPQKDYANLTRPGKIRRISQLAEAAIKKYDIKVRDMRIYRFDTNLLYKVESDTGERFMLRMASPGWRTFDNLRAEAAWLEALDRDTDIGAPVIVRAANGRHVIPMTRPGIPDTWNASLMTWVDGRLLAHYLNETNLEKMGKLFARLHIHGKTWKPPKGFSSHRFNAFLSRGEPNVLFTDKILKTFRKDDKKIFLRARKWVEREYANIDPDDLRVIHCDLWHENIKLDHGKLRPFDFEDTIWGYRLHDIAMSMLDLLEDVGDKRYATLFAAFRAGYERLLDFPKGDLGILKISRLLWKVNYVARFQQKYLGDMSKRYGNIFRSFESTGELVLSPKK